MINKKELEHKLEGLKFENRSLRHSLQHKTKECERLLTDIIDCRVHVGILQEELKRTKCQLTQYKRMRK